jgi:hypothetical protein
MLPSQNLISFDQKILPNSEYASPSSLNLSKVKVGKYGITLDAAELS